MPYGLYVSAEGAQAQSTRLEVIANNLANIDTVGFKRDLAIFQARYAEAVSQGSVSPGLGKLEDIGGGILVQQTKTDFSEGPLKHTQNPQHLAIRGEGFFVVQKGQETFLTRAGDFFFSARGELVTPQGYAVLNESGQPVVINPSEKDFQFTPSGELQQKDTMQQLALVKPASYQDLIKQGENLFRCVNKPQPLSPGERCVAPGYLESSTVRPTIEMTSMIEASRFMEANLNLVKAQDQMLGSLVGRLMRV
ncbi:MAG: flagellar basal-body rod protein FlgF [Pirellulales bacterium]|nr:flagellar basal-body rod protein FlgF [Pirellulales bacterium]